MREFNAGYNYFDGMDSEQIYAEQHPAAGWRQRTVWEGQGESPPPRWADFADPLDAIGARASDIKKRAASTMRAEATMTRFTPREREALTIMGLDGDADRPGLRRRYSELVRQFHPDRNGGDRSQEARLQRVVEAYQLLRKARAFA